MVTAAIGTETDGSITCPASINGIVGPAWSEVPLLALGYAFEQAAKIALTPGLPPSNEDAPDVAEHLRPIR
jgi:Asp-tRNA(Asn)/Glu-tRNA(Gln) amidotransferase A subunit family amidase